jgi:hypothetical protein
MRCDRVVRGLFKTAGGKEHFARASELRRGTEAKRRLF